MDAVEISIELARLKERMANHEESCSMFRKITYSLSAVAVAVISAMAGQMLIYASRQDVQTNILIEHSERMMQMVNQMNRSEDRYLTDLAEIRSDLKGIISNNSISRR